jgi:hypothetical protein
MTQQSEAGGRGDDAAQDAATHGASKYGQNLEGKGKGDPVHAVGIDAAAAQCPSPHPKDATPLEMRTGLARFRSAFPTFSFMICGGWDGPRFEAWRDTNLSGLYAIITDDPDELLRELNMAVR